MRLVLDSNVLIAAFLWSGAPFQLLTSIHQGHASCYTSIALIEELGRALRYPHLAPRIAEKHLDVRSLIERYTLLANIVEPAIINPTVLADPDDDAVLACALAAQADLIASGRIFSTSSRITASPSSIPL